MSREYASYRHLRHRPTPVRGPIFQSYLTFRRYLSRISLVDAGAVLLVWGNILGLIAYPAVAHYRSAAKADRPAAMMEHLASK